MTESEIQTIYVVLSNPRGEPDGDLRNRIAFPERSDALEFIREDDAAESYQVETLRLCENIEDVDLSDIA